MTGKRAPRKRAAPSRAKPKPKRPRPKRAAAKRAAPTGAGSDELALVETTWVHVFEEDGPAGDVYRPESDAIPRSRRTRERLCLFADGSARILRVSPDDRHEAVAAHWTEEGGEITVIPDSAAANVRTLRARLEGKARLVVR